MPHTAHGAPRAAPVTPSGTVPGAPAERAASAGFAAFLCVAPQLLGGAVVQAVPIIAALALLTLLGVAATNRDGGRAPVDLLTVAMLLAILWTAAQAIPIPCGIVRVLDARRAEDVAHAWSLVGLGAPSFCALSRDPGATRVELVEAIAIFASFLAARLLVARGERRFVYRAVAGSGLAMALVAMAHTAAAAPTIFGLYRPEHIRDAPTVAPLMNPNALGGFLAVCVPLTVGLAFSERSAMRRTVAVITAGVLAAAALMTRSRGATLALALGLASLVALAWRQRLREGRSRGRRASLLATGAALTCALGLAVAAWRTPLLDEFRTGHLEKLDVIAAAFDYAWRHRWIGVGRGAFASGFGIAHPSAMRFDHAENFVAEWAAEWGWPVAGGLLVAIAVAFGRRLHRARSFASLGALAALVTLGAHHLADVSLELVGVACIASALLGAGTASTSRRQDTPRLPIGRLARATATVGALLIAALGPGLLRDDLERAARSLRTKLDRGEHAAFGVELVRAVRAHPMRAELAVLAAGEAILRDGPDATRWINRAMQLAPGWATPHVQASYVLWRAGRTGQAILELGAAAERDPHALGALLCPLTRHAPQDIVDAAPRGEAGATFLELASRCLPVDSAEARVVDDALLRRDPARTWARLRQGEHLLASGRAEEALRAARALRRAGDPGSESDLLEARALRATGRLDEALAHLEAAARRAREPGALWTLVARLHAERGNAPALRAAMERVRGAAHGRVEPLRNAWLAEGDLEASLGNDGKALHAYEQAFRITGDIDALSRVASTAERMGDTARAYQALSRLCDLAPERGACARRDALRAKKPAIP